jgi:hypothetical protein
LQKQLIRASEPQANPPRQTNNSKVSNNLTSSARAERAHRRITWIRHSTKHCAATPNYTLRVVTIQRIGFLSNIGSILCDPMYALGAPILPTMLESPRQNGRFALNHVALLSLFILNSPFST